MGVCCESYALFPEPMTDVAVTAVADVTASSQLFPDKTSLLVQKHRREEV